ncbi:MAG: hypothetical protein ACRDWW_06720, partial [Acidimicrobiales bacterium]
STAFKALIQEHGGVTATTAYCKGVVTTQHPGASTGSGSTGTPASPGNSARAPGRSGQAHGSSQHGQSTSH